MPSPFAVLIVFARVLGACWLAPGLSAGGSDVRTRLLLAGLVTATIAPVTIARAEIPAAIADWPGLIAAELGLGAILGGSAALIVAGARQAGEIVGAQAGLSAAALFDPEMGEEATPAGHLYGAVALAVFLLMDGPLAVVRALVESYEAWPVGAAGLTEETARTLFARTGASLSLALRASAPAAAALTLAGLALSLASRHAPALPFTALSLPIRTALGLALMLAGLAALVAVFSDAWAVWPGSPV